MVESLGIRRIGQARARALELIVYHGARRIQRVVPRLGPALSSGQFSQVMLPEFFLLHLAGGAQGQGFFPDPDPGGDLERGKVTTYKFL